MTQRLLITGGAGFIGSNLVRLMLGLGHQVRNLDKLTYAGNLESLADCRTNPNYSFRQIDIADGVQVQSAIDEFAPTAVLHLAAESHVDRSIDSPDAFIQTNVLGTFQLLNASLRYWRRCSPSDRDSFRFLHISTDEVYGSLGEHGRFQETTRYDPHSPYSASKAASDHLVRAWYHTYGLPILLTNCSNNYGPYQFPEKLIPVIILKAIRAEPIPLYGKGQNVRDWLYVLDHCLALSCVLTRGVPGETYNIGGNTERTNRDIVQLVCSQLDKLRPRPDGKAYQEQIVYVEDRPGHDFRYAIDATKIQTELNWQPETSIEVGITSTIQWYLDHPSWWQAILNGSYRLDRLGTSISSRPILAQSLHANEED